MGGAKAADDIPREARQTPEEGQSHARGERIRAAIAHADEIGSLLALDGEEESLRKLHGHDTLSGLFKEIRADEAAAKSEDAHGYGYGKEALRKIFEGTTEVPAAEKSKGIER